MGIFDNFKKAAEESDGEEVNKAARQWDRQEEKARERLLEKQARARGE